MEKIEGLENITIGQLEVLSHLMTMTMTEALPLARKFRDDNCLNDAQAKTACTFARRLFMRE